MSHRLVVSILIFGLVALASFNGFELWGQLGNGEVQAQDGGNPYPPCPCKP
jgi:hypothetical protein